MKPKATCDSEICVFCGNCQESWRELTALKKQSLSFKKGEQIFQEGASVHGMYFTLSGAVKIHKQWGAQKELIIRFAGGGDVIGLRGFGDKTFRVSATALEPVQVCYIPLDHLQASLLVNPALTYKLMQVYAEELQRAEQRMSSLAHMDTKGRVAEAVLTVKDTFGVDSDGFLSLPVSRQDIASFAGTIYETVFKIFTEWINGSVIETAGKRIRVLQEEELRLYMHW